MKLSYYCNYCRKENYLKTKSHDRHGLLLELGTNEIENTCTNCNKTTTKHINRLHAEPSYKIIIGSLIAAAIGTVLLWNYGFVSVLSGTIPIAVWVDQNKKISIFNKSRVK
ncbi:hypothetical protein [Hanstruepera marina]|uniref:hypothetical protein n=1 Tax=Hanstruepera marina TaxID=2873265 RepID=UPI001CA769CB|nr:hypothetical protein [Hanstruepera marina]